jgi:hypothetical protein
VACLGSGPAGRIAGSAYLALLNTALLSKQHFRNST